jgi:hypothetical protein
MSLQTKTQKSLSSEHSQSQSQSSLESETPEDCFESAQFLFAEKHVSTAEIILEWCQNRNPSWLTPSYKLLSTDTKPEIILEWHQIRNPSGLTPHYKSFFNDAKSKLLYERRQIRNRSWVMPNQKSYMRDRQHTINLSEVTSQITLKITIE